MKPIVAASEKGSFHSLDIFYGPLITLLNGRSLFADEGSIGPDISDVFSTNWDLCFKNWVYYNNFGISDGTQLDNQRMSYFSVDRREYEERGRGGRPASRFYYMALHGSLDLTRAQRPIAGGTASYITKLGNPLDYYRSGPDSRENIFMIYPLEAIGYDESIRSPYLDMLYLFKWSLEQTSKLYVVGYSFRDPTVGSIIEEAIGLRMSKSDIKPLPEDFETRKSMARENRFNVIVLTPEAENVRKSLIAQNRMRLAETFVPVEVNFPKVDDSDFKTKYEDELKRIYSNMQRMGIRQGDERHLATAISTRYGLSIT
jgi:hypothetical protein